MAALCRRARVALTIATAALAGADNKALAEVVRVPPRVLEGIDHGRIPDYLTGAAILKLLAHVGGETSWLTITPRCRIRAREGISPPIPYAILAT